MVEEPGETLAVLNELLLREECSLPYRFVESTLFVSSASLDDLDVLRSMVAASKEHAARLVSVMADLGGTPAPRVGDLATADLHFQELHRVLPRLIADQERLVEAYRIAAGRVGPHPRATALVGEIIQRHEADLDALRGLATANPIA